MPRSALSGDPSDKSSYISLSSIWFDPCEMDSNQTAKRSASAAKPVALVTRLELIYFILK